MSGNCLSCLKGCHRTILVFTMEARFSLVTPQQQGPQLALRENLLVFSIAPVFLTSSDGDLRDPSWAVRGPVSTLVVRAPQDSSAVSLPGRGLHLDLGEPPDFLSRADMKFRIALRRPQESQASSFVEP